MQSPTPSQLFFYNWGWLDYSLVILPAVVYIVLVVIHYLKNVRPYNKVEKLRRKIAELVTEINIRFEALADKSIDSQRAMVLAYIGEQKKELTTEQITELAVQLVFDTKISHAVIYELTPADNKELPPLPSQADVVRAIKAQILDDVAAADPNSAPHPRPWVGLIRYIRLSKIDRRNDIERDELPIIAGIRINLLPRMTERAKQRFYRKLGRLSLRRGVAVFKIQNFLKFFDRFFITLPIKVLIFLGPLVLIPAFLHMRLPDKFDGSILIWPWLLAVVAAYALGMALRAPFFYFSKRIDRWVLFFIAKDKEIPQGYIMLGMSFVCLLLIYPAYRWLVNTAERSGELFVPLTVFYFLIIAVIGSALYFTIGFLGGLLANFLNRKYFLFRPKTHLAMRLFDLVYALESNPHQWDDLPFKNLVVNTLEEISIVCESAWSKRMRGGDLEINSWTTNTLNEIALAFRMKKKLVFSPLPDSRQRLIRSLAQSLVNVVEGNWGKLETESAAKLTLREESGLWARRLWALAKAVAISAIPLALLFLLQLVPGFDFPEPYFSYAKIVGAVWFAISLMFIVDPLFDKKLTALKEIKSLGSGSSSGGAPK